MKYLVTGATGFLGRRLVAKLLARANATVYVLIRRASADKMDDLRTHRSEPMQCAKSLGR